MKNFLLRCVSFPLSFASPDLLKSTYLFLSKIKILGKSVNDLIVFFIPKKVKLHDFDFFLNKKDALVSGGIALGVYERYESEVFLSLLKPEMIVVDIGANIGYYSLLASPKVTQVLAFEPDPENSILFKQNLGVNEINNVQIFADAISNTIGEATLFRNPNNFGDRRLYKFDEAVEEFKVTTTTLDSFLQQHNIFRVDLIKIDIQGAEGLALAGMEKTLTLPNLNLFMEFFPTGLKQTGVDPVGLLNNLASKNFKIYNINGNSRKLELITDFEKFTKEFKGIDYVNLYCKK